MSGFSTVVMSESKAAEFVTHWRVVNHRPDTDSGFCATLFERDGENVLAIRGVEAGLPGTEGSDVYHDLLGASVGGIGMLGAAGFSATRRALDSAENQLEIAT